MKNFILPKTVARNHVAEGALALLSILCGTAYSSTLIQITPDNPSTGSTGFVVSSPSWNVLKPNYLSNTGLATYGVADLLDSSGNPTGISLAADDVNKFNGYNSDGSTQVSSGFPVDVKRESFFGNDVLFNGAIRPIATWVFGGFDPNDDLILTFFASRMGVIDVNDNREGLYKVQGETIQSTTLNATNNDSNFASVKLKADASGNVMLNMTKGPNNTNYNGFFYLTAMTVEVIPEPSSALLALLAGLGLCLVRRRD